MLPEMHGYYAFLMLPVPMIMVSHLFPEVVGKGSRQPLEGFGPCCGSLEALEGYTDQGYMYIDRPILT